MLKWVQSGISAVTGLAEPEYGREAIHPITDGLEGKKCYEVLSREDTAWLCPDSTNVETQTFYFSNAETGYMGFTQLIRSDLVGLYSTAQQTFKIFHKDTPHDYVWTSTKLENFKVDGTNFYADNFKIELSEDGKSYHFKSDACAQSIIDMKFERLVDGIKFGSDGTTYYGDNIKEPWGSMRHVFWPRVDVTGSVILNPSDAEESGEEQNKQQGQPKETVKHEIEGKLMFVMALQGMKPHHAAASWNFLHFVGKEHSVVLMEFTTPKSYATTKVNVAIVSNDEKVVSCCINSDVKHLDPKVDEVGWSVPQKLECVLNGVACSDELNSKLVGEPIPESADKFSAIIKGDLTHMSERVDVMAEVPTFVKNIVSGVVGTKPYIYQFCNTMTLSINGGEEEEGVGYSEASFITEVSPSA